MDDLNGKKKSAVPAILGVIVAIILGLGGYGYLKKNSEVTPAPEVAQTETPPTAEQTPPVQTAETPTEEQKPVVVETKKLDIAPVVTEAAPSAKNADPKIAAMMAPRTLGKADAPVKITEYSSLTCSHCGAFHREEFDKFKAQFIDTGRVQMTFREFPLNEPALVASQILRCMPEDKFINFMSLLFAEQDKWAFDANFKDKLKQNAKLAGMSDETFEACANNTALKEAILGDMQAATEKYKVQSTPSFVINNGQNVMIGHQPLDVFDKAITEAATKSAAPAAPATATEQPAMVAPAAAPSTTETPTVNLSAAAADAAIKSAQPESTEESPPPME